MSRTLENVVRDLRRMPRRSLNITSDVPRLASKVRIVAVIVGASLGFLLITPSPTRADCPGGWQEQEVCPECCLPDRSAAPSISRPTAAEAQRQQADSLDRKGVDALDQGDWETAHNLFEAALALAPDSVAIRAHLDIANAHLIDAKSAPQLREFHQNALDADNAATLAAAHQQFLHDDIQIAIPAACLVLGGRLGSTEACDVIDAVRLGWNAASADERRWKILHILAAVGQKTVYLSFGSELGMALESRVNLVQALYSAQAQQFALLVSRLELGMQNDQQAAKLRTEFAISDSAAVEMLRDNAIQESRRNADAATRYIRDHSESNGISFRCDLACHRIVAASREIGVFD